jgi:hypothetical protein
MTGLDQDDVLLDEEVELGSDKEEEAGTEELTSALLQTLLGAEDSLDEPVKTPERESSTDSDETVGYIDNAKSKSRGFNEIGRGGLGVRGGKGGARGGAGGQ